MSGEAPRPTRLRAAWDRVPTAWFATIGTGLVLAATAAFGGLDTAPAPQPVAVEPGAPFDTEPFVLTATRAVLSDELSLAGAYPADGQRVLAVLIEVENTHGTAQSSMQSLAHAVTVSVTDEPVATIARTDDETLSPWLQPRVPAEVVLTWLVDAEELKGGDPVTVTLHDLTLHTGSFVAAGQWWTDPRPAATLALTVEDRGAGS